jgi:hypothetical protein
MPGDVITVHTARPGLEDGRGVKVPHAQPSQVGHDPHSLVEGEPLVHLGAVRGDGNANIGLKERMNAVLVHGFRQIWVDSILG